MKLDFVGGRAFPHLVKACLSLTSISNLMSVSTDEGVCISTGKEARCSKPLNGKVFTRLSVWKASGFDGILDGRRYLHKEVL